MEKPCKSWNEFFKRIESKDYCGTLHEFLNKEYRDYVCYPDRNLLFNAFMKTKLQDVKVVIIGQDPYHDKGQAMGLSFSVPSGVKTPPSLVNIYKEIELEYGKTMDLYNGDLTYLSDQGVLLLNAILSVREHQPLSHNIKDYRLFLVDVLEALDRQPNPIVFMLWGGPARKLKTYLHNPTHLILESNHPSPLSANRGGWFGNNHFKTANDFLFKNKRQQINWINKK